MPEQNPDCLKYWSLVNNMHAEVTGAKYTAVCDFEMME
jgi:hypothetical protein